MTIAAAAQPPLRTAAEVKRLSVDEAARRHPVLLTGVVTQVMPEWGSFAFQDRTEALYVAAATVLPAGLHAGQSVTIEGVTARANFAPAIRATGIRVLGPAALPAPRRISWEDLATGRCDNNLIEAAGVIRSAAPIAPPAWSWPALALRVDLGGKIVRVYIRDAGALAAHHLVDATARARGVCIVLSNAEHQFEGLAISATGEDALTVTQPAPADPFQAPLATIGNLFRFQEAPASLHRVRVQGIVTHQHGSEVYLQDGTHAMLVRATSPPPLQPGDLAEAVGFPAAAGFTTILEDAVLKPAGRAAEPTPREILARFMLARVQNAPAAPAAVLVRTAGRVVDRIRTTQDDTLLMDDSGTTFSARLPAAAGTLAGFEPGARVTLTGICTVQLDDQGVPGGFTILLRSPADVRILQRAPWLTSPLIWRAALALLGFLLAAMLWVTLLRRRVIRQTATIRTQEQRYRDLVENATDLVWVRDLEGRILQVNRGAEAMTGYSRDELLRANVTDLLVPEERDRVRRELTEGPGESGARSAEWRIRTKAGGDLVIEMKERFLQEEGASGRVESIGRDITARHREQNRLAEQLQHSQKLESVGLLAGGVAHDFNNLLTVIAGYAQMLQEDLPEGDGRTRANEILQAAERASGLTRQLLLFSRRQRPAARTIDLNGLLHDLQKMLRRLIREDIALTLALDANPGLIHADPGHIEQVAMNLVVNARDAMPDGGKLEIRTARFHATAAFAADNLDIAPGDYIVLEVTDSGTGIPADIRERIFEPFFTTKEQGKGTGLGLSTVYGIVKQSNGTITVDSAPGRTCFRVLFPAAAAQEETEARQIPAAAPVARANPIEPAAAKTILVAEDEAGVRAFIRDVLRGSGYTVLEARNGHDALRQAAAHSGSIDLLLTDTAMPDLGGIGLAEEFAHTYPAVPILHMSGYTDRPLPAGIDLIQKPFTPAGLLAHIRRHVGS